MKDLLISILETICPDHVYLQGTLNADENFPQKFITFFVTDTEDKEFFDNQLFGTEWNFSVIFYSNDPDEVKTIPAQISAALKQAGFIPQGKGRDITSSTPNYTGWAMEFLIRENENN